MPSFWKRFAPLDTFSSVLRVYCWF